jgi:hypothetical protein
MAIASVQLPTPGTATVKADIKDNNGAPLSVIETAKPWSVQINLHVDFGGIFDGFAHFDLWVQQLGGPRSGKVGSTVIDFGGDGDFAVALDVIANHPLFTDVIPGFPLPHPATDSGVYHVVLVMTHHNAPGNVGLATEAAAVIDFGVLRVS